VIALVVVLTALAGWSPRLAQALADGGVEAAIWVARQAGTDAVGAALADADPVAARAAAIAAPHTDDAWSLLDELAAAAGGWDRARAVDATRAALAIVESLDGDAAVEGELPDDVLAGLGTRWLGLARRADRWPDVRVSALEIAARIARARAATAAAPSLGYDLAELLADPDPAVRRAAAELVPQPASADQRAALVTVIVGDAEPEVVVAAAQALCGDVAHDDPAPILAALGAAGLDRLRAVLSAPGAGALPSGAVVDAARCLRADGSGASRAALAALAGRAPPAVKAALGRVR
jgi:hypothetical protein